MNLSKTRLTMLLAGGVLVSTIVSTQAAVTTSKTSSDGAQYTIDGGALRLQFWSPEIVRVTYAPTNKLPESKSLSVVAKAEKVRLTRQENGQAFTLASPRLKVKIDKQTGAVTLFDAADRLILNEAAQGRIISNLETNQVQRNYTIFKFTGDEHYLDVARVLLFGTKAMLALPGRTYDLKGPGWQQEHWRMGPIRGIAPTGPGCHGSRSITCTASQASKNLMKTCINVWPKGIKPKLFPRGA